jgi:FkbM family methyltransferase
MSSWIDAYWCISRLGPKGYRQLRSLYEDRSDKHDPKVEIRFPNLLFPLAVRPGTSDASELMQTLVRGLYSHYLPTGSVKFIVDAGAYIGDTAAFYLSHFPEARVVSLEPDLANFAAAQHNLRLYGTRVTLLRAALWPYEARLSVSGEAVKCSISVSEVVDGSQVADCPGLTLSSLLRDLGETRIDLLKCDIEGAEVEVFSKDCDEWLSLTQSIFIEIHSTQALQVVLAATTRHGFTWRAYRNIHIFHRNSSQN